MADVTVGSVLSPACSCLSQLIFSLRRVSFIGGGRGVRAQPARDRCQLSKNEIPESPDSEVMQGLRGERK